MPDVQCQPLIEDSDSVPKWMNAEYFERVLRKSKEDPTIKVQSVQVKYALPKGDNYASTIFRAQVVFHSKNLPVRSRSYIIKGTVETETAKQKLGEYDVHRKEMDVYQMVIPELFRLSRSIGDHSDLYPSALFVDRENEVMIFNDLSRRGYVMPNRLKGLDQCHTEMSLKLMAKLHASSLKLAEIYPTIFDRYKTGLMTRETDAFYSFFYSNYDALTEEISTWEPEWHYYSDKLRKLRPHFVEQGLAVYDNDHEDDLRVFVHGDLWLNNLMFKYDPSGTPIDAVVLDFQYCCRGSPAIDLLYFFFTSAKDEIRQNRFEELMQYYYHNLADYARRLNCSKKFPSLHQFQRELTRKMFYAFFSSFISLPVHMNEVTTDADFDALMGVGERGRRFKKAMVANPKYHKIIKGLLPTFDRKGLLDKLE